MLYLKGSACAAVILISGMYGWYLMATAINQQADQAATVIIQDVVSSNMATDIRSLRKIQSLMEVGQSDKAFALADEVIESKLYMLSQCVSEKCMEVRSKLNSGRSL